MILDIECQFDTTRVTDYLGTFGYQAWFTTVAHPQTNGQADAANKVILHGLQKRLDEAEDKWANELHGVPWLLRTTKKTAIIKCHLF